MAAFVDAFVSRDVTALVGLLAADVRFTMPPAAWFDGRTDVAGFLVRRVFATPWRAVPFADVNGRPAVVGHQLDDGAFRPGALIVLHIAGWQITWVATFVDPGLPARFGIS